MANFGAFGCAIGGSIGNDGLGDRVAQITISVAYAPSVGEPFYQEMTVSQGTTLAQAIKQSGVLSLAELGDFDEWLTRNADATPNHKAWYVGIYSVKKRTDTPLVDGDRVEIYRALSDDPMSRRKAKTKATIKKLSS